MLLELLPVNTLLLILLRLVFPPLMTVATLVEQYKHSEDPSEAPCSGYVDKFVVPPSPKLNANLTLLQ